MSNNRALGDFAANLSVDPSTGVATFNKDLILGANAKLATPGSTSDSLVNKSQVDVVSKLLIKGLFSNLNLATTGTGPTVSIVADEIVLQNSTGGYIVAKSVNLAPSVAVVGTAVVGVDGMDSNAAVTTNTWYSVWIVSDGTNVKGLISPSATSPSLPTGFTYKVRVGWIKTDTSGNKYPYNMVQVGKRVKWRFATGSNISVASPLGALFSGVAGNLGTPTFASNQVRGVFTPSSATAAEVQLWKDSTISCASVIATSAAYGPANTNGSRPPMLVTAPAGVYGSLVNMLLLESDYLYYAADAAGSGATIVGWEDNI